MKPLEDCTSIDDIRAAIDEIDLEVVSLLGLRGTYVHGAAAFKSSEAGVRAPARVQAMLAQRRRWAEERGLDPGFIEQLYGAIVDYFVRRELSTWQKGREG